MPSPAWPNSSMTLRMAPTTTGQVETEPLKQGKADESTWLPPQTNVGASPRQSFTQKFWEEPMQTPVRGRRLSSMSTRPSLAASDASTNAEQHPRVQSTRSEPLPTTVKNLRRLSAPAQLSGALSGPLGGQSPSVVRRPSVGAVNIMTPSRAQCDQTCVQWGTAPVVQSRSPSATRVAAFIPSARLSYNPASPRHAAHPGQAWMQPAAPVKSAMKKRTLYSINGQSPPVGEPRRADRVTFGWHYTVDVEGGISDPRPVASPSPEPVRIGRPRSRSMVFDDFSDDLG